MQSLFNHQIFPVASQLPPIYTVVPMSLKDSQTSDVTCVHIMRNLIFLRLNVEFGKIYANLPNNHAPQTVPLLSCINTASSLWWKEQCFALINPLRLYLRPRLNDTFHSVPVASLVCLQDTVCFKSRVKNNALGGLPIVYLRVGISEQRPSLLWIDYFCITLAFLAFLCIGVFVCVWVIQGRGSLAL